MQAARLLVAVGVVSLFGIRAHEAGAVGVAAGTSIDNTAQVTYTVGSVSATATSNTTSVTVAEILDVVVTLQTPSVPVIAGATQQAMLFRVTNTGNGPENFRLQMASAIGGDEFDPSLPRHLSTSTRTRAVTFRPATRRTWLAATIRC